MASAMAGLIAQPSLQGITQASPSSLNSSNISRPRFSCSLGFTSKSGFGKHTIVSAVTYKSGSSPGNSNSSRLRSSAASAPNEPSLELGGGGNGAGLGGGKSGGGGGGGGDSYGKGESEGRNPGGVFGALWKGWDDRVRADPQFPFKVLMEEIVGVGACVLGDMASRPNFGLNELDFVFCTLVVGAILNFSLMYMLAPTSAVGAVATKLPGLFAACPTGHMFEPGSFSLLERAGTFVYKGGQFAVVGFFAGLVGTAISNTLLMVRKKLDPEFVAQNEPPPTLLNAATWALHMGLSSNSRYQSLNGLEFALANKLSPPVFKTGVLVLRALNNVVGGTTFVLLARLTGSQKKSGSLSDSPVEEVEEKLLDVVGETRA